MIKSMIRTKPLSLRNEPQEPLESPPVSVLHRRKGYPGHTRYRFGCSKKLHIRQCVSEVGEWPQTKGELRQRGGGKSRWYASRAQMGWMH